MWTVETSSSRAALFYYGLGNKWCAMASILIQFAKDGKAAIQLLERATFPPPSTRGVCPGHLVGCFTLDWSEGA